MEINYVKEKLKRLNLTNEIILEIEKHILSLPNEETANAFLILLEKSALQHYIREFMKQNMVR